MPRWPKSDTKKAQLANEEKDSLMKRAVELYKNKLKKPENRMGLQAVCEEVSRLHFIETGKNTKINHTTLKRQVDGKKSKA